MHDRAGNFDTAHCISCHREVAQGVVRKAVDEGKICTCPTCDGYVKPDIVFFGSCLPCLGISDSCFPALSAEQDFTE